MSRDEEVVERYLLRWLELREQVAGARNYVEWLDRLAQFLAAPRYERLVEVVSASTGKKGNAWGIDEQSSLKKVALAYVSDELKFRSVVPDAAKPVLVAQMREVENWGAQVMLNVTHNSRLSLVFGIEDVRKGGRQTRAIAYRKAFVVQIAQRA